MPAGESYGFEAIRELRVSHKHVERFRNAYGNNGYLQFIAQEPYHGLGLAKLLRWTNEKIVNLIDDKHTAMDEA